MSNSLSNIAADDRTNNADVHTCMQQLFRNADSRCLKRAKTGRLAEMPEPGVLLCFLNTGEAELYRQMIGCCEDFMPIHLSFQEMLRQYTRFALWKSEEPTAYTGVQFTAAQDPVA